MKRIICFIIFWLFQFNALAQSLEQPNSLIISVPKTLPEAVMQLLPLDKTSKVSFKNSLVLSISGSQQYLVQVQYGKDDGCGVYVAKPEEHKTTTLYEHERCTIIGKPILNDLNRDGIYEIGIRVYLSHTAVSSDRVKHVVGFVFEPRKKIFCESGLAGGIFEGVKRATGQVFQDLMCDFSESAP